MSEQAKPDRRIKKTKTAIEQTFIELLKKKSFHKITVSDIIDAVDISRSTFYLHYLDKYDLLDKIQDELLDTIAMKLSSLSLEVSDDPQKRADSYKTYVLWTLEVFQENAELIRLFLKIEEAYSFVSKLQDITKFNIGHNLYPWFDVNDIPVPENYVSIFVSSSHNQLIFEWLKNGCKESPQEIYEYFRTLWDSCAQGTLIPHEMK